MKIKMIPITFLALASIQHLAAQQDGRLEALPLDEPSRDAAAKTDDLPSPETTGLVGGIGSPGTGISEADTKDELTERLESIKPRFQRIMSDLDKLEKRRTEDVSTGIYNTSEDGRLDFEDHHEKMIAGLTRATDFSRKYRFLSGELSQLAKEIFDIGSTITLDMKGEGVLRCRLMEKEVTEAATLCQRSLDEVTEYRNSINDTLIETVHRYHVRNNFRFFMGAGWFGCFVVLALVCFSLFKRKILVPQDSSSLQLVAMVMIIFVVMLFGITDVIGENGVTGILAAIAGYILGKSSLNDSVPRRDDGNGSDRETVTG